MPEGSCPELLEGRLYRDTDDVVCKAERTLVSNREVQELGTDWLVSMEMSRRHP